MRRAKWILFVGTILSIFMVGREYVDAETLKYTFNGDTFYSYEKAEHA